MPGTHVVGERNVVSGMTRRRDTDSGKYERVYTLEDVIEVLDETRLGTTEVSEAVGCHRSTAIEKLRELETDGRVRSQNVGNTLIRERTDSE